VFETRECNRCWAVYAKRLGACPECRLEAPKEESMSEMRQSLLNFDPPAPVAVTPARLFE
jgi:predicted ATP-dependent serine protease